MLAEKPDVLVLPAVAAPSLHTGTGTGGAAGLQEGAMPAFGTGSVAGASAEAWAAAEELQRAHARELWRATGAQ